MLDIKFIRENPQIVCQALEDRGLDFDLDGFLKLDEKRRSFIKEIDSLRTELNKINDEISSLLKEKKDPKPKIEQTREISKKLDGLEEEFKKVKEQFTQQLLNIPNIPHPSIPKGSPANNKVVRTWGEPKTFSFKPLTHIELAENLGIIDFKRASKITGSNFILFKGQGALLERAL
ncbi:MAG: serine--tRNA ligase, partial [Candidatus Omnitrophota bacterium]